MIQPTVSLTESVIFPEQYQTACLSVLSRIWNHYQWQMQERFGFYNITPLDAIQITRTFLAEEIALIARAAAGEIDRENEDLAGELNETIQSTLELLFSSPLITGYQIPDEFWYSEFGQIVARAIVWLRQDQLITVTEAAELRGVSVQAISNAVRDGRLRRYVDPDEPNPQRQTLVSRDEVDALK